MSSPFDLPAARAALLAEAVQLRALLGEPIEGPGQMTYGSQAAAASQVFAQQRDLAIRDHERAQLALVNAAQARLAAGTYGLCVTCAKPIAIERLEAIPWAAACIGCARAPSR